MFRRLNFEPALWLNLIAALIAWLSVWAVHLTTDQQAVLNATAFTVANLIVAIQHRNGQSAAALAVFKAVIALGLGFGMHISPAFQTTVITLFAAGSAMFIHSHGQPKAVTVVSAPPNLPPPAA